MARVDDQQKFREQDEQNTRNRANLIGLPYVDTRDIVKTSPLFPDVLPVEDMKAAQVIPLNGIAEREPLIFGITISTPQQKLRELRDRFHGKNVQFTVISNSGFKEFMLRYDPPKKVEYSDVKVAREDDANTIAQVSATLDSVRPDEVLDYLIKQADRLNASDVHLEMQRSDVRVRFRIDGTLHPIANLTHEKYRILLGALASRANISTAANQAQTGHMLQDIKKDDGNVKQLNMRIETVPTIYGQDAVIRLFNFDPSLLQVKNLGLTSEQQTRIDQIVEHPHGMVMVVGPTGSGKSTTLYSMLNALNNPSRKILTLEDPVELSLPGVSQIPVNTRTGDSFAEKLRAVLRLDPDVVMVGEIRDVDTARTAIQASVTGHLVLSTFHASTAATAFSRIIDMLGTNPIFSTAVRLVMGQRLVRRLDDKTKVAYKPDEATVKYISDVLADLPKGVKKPDLNNLTLYKPGSSADNPFGYTGRIVIIEQMVITPEIQAFLRGDVKDVNPTAIENAAKEQGMVTMLQDGILKACNGVTTLEEISRTI